MFAAQVIDSSHENANLEYAFLPEGKSTPVRTIDINL